MCRVLLVHRSDPDAPPISFDLPHSVAFLHVANAWEVGDWVHVALCRYGNRFVLSTSLNNSCESYCSPWSWAVLTTEIASISVVPISFVLAISVAPISVLLASQDAPCCSVLRFKGNLFQRVSTSLLCLQDGGDGEGP